jgi:hypothetical protein
VVLATTTDVETALSRPLTSVEDDRANQLLNIASSAVLLATGQRVFAPGDYTLTRVVRDRRVRIPATVHTVNAVRRVDDLTGAETALTGWTARGNVIYQLRAVRTVAVDFTVTAAIPQDVVDVVAGVVAATLSMPPVGTNSEQIGPYQVSYADSTGRVWLSKSDKAVLAKYRRGASAAAMLL